MDLKKSKFHFVGIGGIGMCGLAELLHNMGAQVTGSDSNTNGNTERLEKMGVGVFHGHRAEQVKDANVVVYSSAINESNPEIKEARAKKIPLIPRAEALAEIMRLKRGVALAGTHGKTTTTSMVSSIFLNANVNPTIVVGGRFEMIQSTALLGDGDWLIAEADESDGSFHKLSPEIAVITNIDSDHLDHYKSFENLEKSFYSFALRVPFYGLTIVCGDDPVIEKLFKDFPKRIQSYGFNQTNDYWIKGENGKYEVFENEGLGQSKKIGAFHLHVPGRHNALNALAAIVVGLWAGLSFDLCKSGIEKYNGVDRRFQFKGEAGQIKVYDDYGHHPTEVRATLQGFKEKFPNNRIVVMFQPHRYSRTQSCWYEFTTCFADADKLFVTDIYAAGESPIPNIDSARLAKDIKHQQCQYIEKNHLLVGQILETLKEGDIFLTLGAGDGWKVGIEILQALKNSFGQSPRADQRQSPPQDQMQNQVLGQKLK